MRGFITRPYPLQRGFHYRFYVIYDLVISVKYEDIYMAVQSNNRAGNSWFDLRGIQTKGTIDSDIRAAILAQFKRAIQLVSPDDIVNMGLGVSSTPGVDMSGDAGEVLVQLQEQNQNLQAQNNQLGQRVADLTAAFDKLRAQQQG